MTAFETGARLWQRGPRHGAAPSPAPRAEALEIPDFGLPPGMVRSRRAEAAAEAAAQAEAARLAALEAARREGLAEGEAAGRAAASAEHAAARATAEAAALAAAAAALARIEAAAGEVVAEAATDLARLLLAALDAALPAAALRLAPESALHLASLVRPILAHAAEVTLTVGPGLGAAVTARLADHRIVVLEDHALPPGDARAAWPGGGAVAALAERRGAVAEVLDGLGLGPASPTTPETPDEVP